MATETTATDRATVAPEARHERQILTGRVTSAKMEKTIVVEVLRLVQHPKYRRVVRISKKFYAHDEKREAKTGRHRADRFRAAALKAEALAAERNADAKRVGGISGTGRADQ